MCAARLVAILMLPVGVLMAFIAMRWIGVGSNIMSLGGIAIAVGAMVDAAIVMIENAHKHIERLRPDQSRAEAVIQAAKEVGPALFFSLLIITVSFLPVFTLEAQEGRLFAPLAYTKTFAMAGAAMLSVTLVPVLMLLFIRGRIPPEAKNPVNRLLIALYRPVIATVLRWKKLTIVAAVAALVVTIWPAMKLGSEFMPTLNEGTLFYMPTGLPSMSVTKAAELLQTQNKIIKSFPEVASVIGKAGRANTATDPAPLEMFETVINLKPESEWRPGMTIDKLIAELDRALQFPGIANSWTMPIKARIDMLSTGIRTPVGIKVFGKDLAEMEHLAKRIEAVVRQVPGTSSAYAERITGGYYLDIEPDRAALARYGINPGELQEVVATAIGGEMVTTTVEGRERFGVTVRYPRELRDSPDKIARQVLVPVMGEMGGVTPMIPLGQLAKVGIVKGAPAIRTENALLSAYIYVDIRERDIGSYVAEARRAVADQVKFPPGYYATWSGQFEYMERAAERLRIVVPFTLLIIFLLLYLNFRRLTETLIVMLSVPFALVGGVWLMWALGYNLSVAAAVGFIALAGVAAETGVVMLIYLDHAWRARPRPSWRPAEVSRSLRRGDGGCRRARAAKDDDRHRHHGRPAAHHVEQRRRFGGDAPHRGTHGWGYDFFDRADSDRHPGDLHGREGTALVVQWRKARMNLEDYAAVLKDLAIPPRPAVVTVLFEEMSKDEPNLGRVTKTIAADPGLSAGMLRAANSPFFGLSRKVSSVPQAIKVLGLTHVANIATGLAIRHALKGGETGQSFEKFWMKAEETGMICHFLARSLRGFSPDEAFTYGLFHDCGIPVLSQRFPRYRDTLKGAAKATGLQDPGLEAGRYPHQPQHSWLLSGAVLAAARLHLPGNSVAP